MKTGRTLIELATELERQKESKHDYIADTRAIVMHGSIIDHEDPVRINMPVNDHNDSFGLTTHAHQQVAARVKIPKPYYDRMLAEAPDLLASNVNRWFRDQPERRMIRTLDGRARAFLSDRYRPLDNADLAEVVLPRLMDLDCRVESCEVTATRMYIKAVTPRIKAEVSVGDEVQAGLIISNSEVGAGSLQVSPLIYRLICSNGMIASDSSLRKYHIGRRNQDIENAAEFFRDETRQADDRAFFMKVRDVVAATLSGDTFAQIVARWREAKSEKIEGDPMKAVEVTATKLGLTDGERGGVLRHLIEGGDLSRYGLMNAITRFAQDVDSYDRSTELETVGPRVIELPRQDWTAISEAS